MKKFRFPPREPRAPSAEEEQKAAASRRSRTGRARGRKFEKGVAEDIRAALDAHPEDVKRTPAAVGGKDIILHHALRSRFPFYCECKDTKTLSVPAWIEQTEAGVKKDATGLVPAIIFKLPKRSKKYVIIPFDVFLKLTQEVYDACGHIPTEEP